MTPAHHSNRRPDGSHTYETWNHASHSEKNMNGKRAVTYSRLS